MQRSNLHSSRRAILALGGGAVLAVATAALVPRASAKASKADLQYRDRPNNGAMCAACKFFTPGSSGDAGTCAMVEGTVSPEGWCMAFSPAR
jgi:hypothetical protein